MQYCILYIEQVSNKSKWKVRKLSELFFIKHLLCVIFSFFILKAYTYLIWYYINKKKQLPQLLISCWFFAMANLLHLLVHRLSHVLVVFLHVLVNFLQVLVDFLQILDFSTSQGSRLLKGSQLLKVLDFSKMQPSLVMFFSNIRRWLCCGMKW